MFRDLWSAKLVEEPVQSRGVEIMSSASTPTIGTLGEGCRIRILNSPAQAGQHEVYELAFQHQGSLDNAPHGPKAKEQLMVISGALEITSGANKALVHARDTAHYDPSCPHAMAFAKPFKHPIIVSLQEYLITAHVTALN